MGGSYGYGWSVRKVGFPKSKDKVTSISHGGGINGFNTLIERLVDHKHLIVLFNNTGGAPLAEIGAGIRNILYGHPYSLPKKSIANVIYEVLVDKGIETAIKQYEEYKKNNPKEYNFTANELNRLGYHLLQTKKIKEAIEIFKLNVKVYPKYANGYDSLAEAYMLNGDKELAIKNYAKSLELNPKNTNAIDMLNKIKKEK
jgi:tetratricopeptide (TPR) repeat protein